MYDKGNEWLVTDIAHELSAELERTQTSPLFDESRFEYDLSETDHENTLYSCDINECLDLRQLKEEDDSFTKEQSPSSSGSEASSTDAPWILKGDIDSPPVTPPNVVPTESIRLISQTDGSLYSLPVASKRPKIVTKSILANESPPPPPVVADLCRAANGLVKISAPPPTKPLTTHEMQQQQARRKQERMIRNRESAYLSRKRAKEHVMLLEQQVQQLSNENARLKKENSDLKERLGKHEPNFKQNWHKIPIFHKKTTALLAIAVTVCINLNSLSLFEDSALRSGESGGQPPSSSNHHTRSLLWVNPLDEELSNLTTSCPVAINQTESLRLERELREWIDGGDISSNFVPKHFNAAAKNISGRRKRIPRARRLRAVPPDPLDMWGLRPSLLDLEGLYEAIHRRADTFYLVSFSADHLLLPAAASSGNITTHRPKMSVMLPAFLSNASAAGGGRMEMMQIDCEVINTQMLSVRGDDIPSSLRTAHKFPNASINSVDGDNGGVSEDSYSVSGGPLSFIMNLSRQSVGQVSANFTLSRPSSYNESTTGLAAQHFKSDSVDRFEQILSELPSGQSAIEGNRSEKFSSVAPQPNQNISSPFVIKKRSPGN